MAEKATETYEGGCFCGKIRYRIRASPTDPTLCHCTLCRRTTGAPVVAWATFSSKALEWVSGAPRIFSSSERAERGFCSDCGAALIFRYHEHPDWVDVTLASLDDPNRVAPANHTFTQSRIQWMRFADGLPRYRRERTGE